MSIVQVEQTFYEVTKYEKRKTLKKLIEVNDGKRIVVFVDENRNADVLAVMLSDQRMLTSSIHGGRSRRNIELALKNFRSGRHTILVATSEALVLDVKNVDVVVNFDLPKSIEEYLRRIGRTGRDGFAGKAISFFDANQDAGLVDDLTKILLDETIPDFLQSKCDSTDAVLVGDWDLDEVPHQGEEPTSDVQQSR